MRNQRQRRPSSRRLDGYLPSFLRRPSVGSTSSSISSLRRKVRTRRSPFSFIQKWWYRIGRALVSKRAITLVNLVTLVIMGVLLVIQLRSRWGQTQKNVSELPFPLNLSPILSSSSRSSASSRSRQHRGFASVRNATFRSRFPSVTLQNRNTFDGIFVVTSGGCPARYAALRRVINRELKMKLTVTVVVERTAHSVSLEAPPLPLAEHLRVHALSGTPAFLLRKQLARTHAHRRVWAAVTRKGLQRVLVLSDSVFLNAYGAKYLPGLLSLIDVQSMSLRSPWHYIFLRRAQLSLPQPSQVELEYTQNAIRNNMLRVSVAAVSHGADAYVLSLQGAEFLSREVTAYDAPLEVKIARLQQRFADSFVALHVCHSDQRSRRCDEVVRDVDIPTPHEKSSLECTWRQLIH